jgi:glutathione S-transferase
MKLYGVGGSPFVRKARIALEEKGLPYQMEELISLPGRKTPEHLALHPMGKIPILRDGELVVPDSSVICAYLEKKHPKPALYPDDPAAYAKALFLEEYADTKLFEVLVPVLFERVVKRFVFQQEPDEARVAHQLDVEIPPVLDYLERQLPEGGGAALGRFGIADVALGAQLGSLTLSGIGLDAERWPKSASWFSNLGARPSFETALAP